MKIVDSPRPVSKSEQYRQVIRDIAGKEKAAFFEKESDFKNFCKIARALKLQVKTSKLIRGGWCVWLR